MSTRARWTRVRRAVALLAAIIAAASIVILFMDWHVVRVHTGDPSQLFGALYFGPDYRVTDEARREMFQRGWSASVTEHACTGLDHLGIPTLVAIATTLLLALVAAVVKTKTRIAAVTVLVATVAANVVIFHEGFFRHLLEDVGPNANVVGFFHALQQGSVVVAAGLCVAAWAAARR
jgi:hypothetical protein